jgi:MFS family permease
MRLLPAAYRKLLVGVGLFGLGAFAHTLLILLATEKLAPKMGVTKAASVAVALYVLHNIFYASFAFIGGWLGDRLPKNRLLAIGYLMSAAMSLCIIILPAGIGVLALIFVLGGTNVALEETLEDSLCAELVVREHHGVAFGAMATVNGIGDFFSSIIVGALWTAFGTAIAFGYSAALSMAGAILVLQLRSPTGRSPGEQTSA